MKVKYWEKMEGETVADLLNKWGSIKPDKEALVFKDKRFTWEEVDKITDRIATYFIDIGLKKGDKFGILGPNHPEMILSWWAAAKVGIIPIPINTRLREKEILYVLQDSNAVGVIAIDEFDNYNFYEILLKLKKSLPNFKHLIVHNTTDKDFNAPTFNEIASTSADNHKIKQNQPKASDILVILYTSGTTGVPKGVVHTHNSMFIDSKTYIPERYWITSQDVHLMAMPWTHMIGHENFNNTCLLLGQKNVLMEKYNPVEYIKLLELEEITWFAGVPTMLVLPIIRIPEIKEKKFPYFRFAIVCGFYCPPDQMKLIKETYKIDIIQLVGSTECGCMLSNSRIDEDEKIFNTVGRPLSNKIVKIIDKNGNELKNGEIGEICYRGPALFKEYFNKPDLTKESVDEDGYWHSGDLGKVVDELGNIAFMGRSKEVIIRGGFNIYPVDIEAFILNLPNVEHAVLVGYPDPVLGEKTCCYIVFKKGTTPLTEDQIREACKKEMSNYKVPDIIKIVDEIPLLPSGKANREILKKQLLKELGLE